MKTPVFDGVVGDAHNRRDFGESDHFPKTACEKETQRNEFEKPSHSRKKKTVGGEDHHPFVNVAASASVRTRVVRWGTHARYEAVTIMSRIETSTAWSIRAPKNDVLGRGRPVGALEHPGRDVIVCPRRGRACPGALASRSVSPSSRV